MGGRHPVSRGRVVDRLGARHLRGLHLQLVRWSTAGRESASDAWPVCGPRASSRRLAPRTECDSGGTLLPNKRPEKATLSHYFWVLSSGSPDSFRNGRICHSKWGGPPRDVAATTLSNVLKCRIESPQPRFQVHERDE